MSAKQERFTREFIAGIEQFGAMTTRNADRLIRAVASDVGEALVVGNEYGPGTPVDTGNARGHWYTTIGDGEPGAHPHPPQGTEGRDVLTQQAMEGVALAAATVQMGDVISFNNDADYIEVLNNGHSQQAPEGMTDIVAMNFPLIIDRAGQRLGIKE